MFSTTLVFQLVVGNITNFRWSNDITNNIEIILFREKKVAKKLKSFHLMKALLMTAMQHLSAPNQSQQRVGTVELGKW